MSHLVKGPSSLAPRRVWRVTPLPKQRSHSVLTILVSGPVNLPIPQGAQLMMADTADDMLSICERELPCDIAVHAAEVAAWCLDKKSKNELSATRAGEKVAVSLARTPDILNAIGSRKESRPSLVVGLTASTDGSGSAEARLKQTQCDLIVARDQNSLAGPYLLRPPYRTACCPGRRNIVEQSDHPGARAAPDGRIGSEARKWYAMISLVIPDPLPVVIADSQSRTRCAGPNTEVLSRLEGN